MMQSSQNQVVQINQNKDYFEVILKCEESIFQKLQNLLENEKQKQKFNIKKNILPMYFKSFLNKLKKNKNDKELYEEIKAILISQQFEEKDFGKVQNLNTLLDSTTPIATVIREKFDSYLDYKKENIVNSNRTYQTSKDIYCKLIVKIKKLIRKQDPNRFKKFLTKKQRS